MPWIAIELTPGVDTELTPTSLRAGYAATQNGRFKSGLFQKLGGWSQFAGFTLGGVPKFAHTWQTIAGAKYLAAGTTTQLTAISSGAPSVITPQTFTSSTTPNFTTSAGSAVVTVVDTNISTVTPYCSVYFNTPITVDGIILSGAYQVATYLSATSYTITAATTGAAGVASGGAVPAFTTVITSNTITVTFANHGLSAGGDIVFPVATTVGGITIQGRYVVQSVTSGSAFTISAPVQATSSAGPTSMNGGSAGLLYYVTQAPAPAAAGYGTGTYGSGAYGVGVLSPGMSGTAISATDWSLANWGQDLIACPDGGGVYYWDPTSSLSNASLIPQAPLFCTGAFVSVAQQMIITYGASVNASIGQYQDPMTVKWCDVQNFFQWSPTIQNQAGSFRISTGSKIVSGAAMPVSNLIWTDIDLWQMNYIGYEFVFSFVKTGSNCGIIAKHAHAQLAGNAYWMGNNNFFVLSSGTVSTLKCPVWDVVFQDLDTTNSATCFAGSNSLFSEIWFFYPSKADGLGYPSRYVKYNIQENTWDYGSMQRNTWIDQTAFGLPIACTNNGIIYSHESGTDAASTAMTCSFTSGYFYVDEGRQITFVDQIEPDFKFGLFAGTQAASVQVTVSAIDDMGAAPRTYGPFNVTSATNAIPCRIRGRQLSITCSSSDSSSWWRLGRIRMRYSTDGRR